jgi:hypothetical protein
LLLLVKEEDIMYKKEWQTLTHVVASRQRRRYHV